MKIGLTVLWPVHSQILPVASFSVNSFGDSSCSWREGPAALRWPELPGWMEIRARQTSACFGAPHCFTGAHALARSLQGDWLARREPAFLGCLGSDCSQFLPGSAWTRGTWTAFLSPLLVRVCITPTGWTKSSSVKCIY